MQQLLKYFTPLAIAAALSTLTQSALADRSIIKNPGQHPDYSFEAEPHLLLGLWGFLVRAAVPVSGSDSVARFRS